MTQTVSYRRGRLYITVIVLLYNCFPALGDFRVLDKLTNQVVFQTASDFVRTGCGSFVNYSNLITSDPIDACQIPAGPPVTSETGVPEHQWVLLASGEGECDLKTKFRNAASAGYCGIIVGTDEPHEDIVKPGLIEDDDEEFIDVHLVNSLDIRILSKKFTQSRQFVVAPPSLSRCKEEYQRTWIRSRYIALFIRAWKRCMEICWMSIKWILVTMGDVTIAIKSTLPSVFHNRDTFSSIAISLASIFTSITIMMIISIQNTAKKLLEFKGCYEEPTPDNTRKNSESATPRSDTKKDHEYIKGQQRSHSFDSNASSFPRRSSAGFTVDYTVYHRLNLDIRLNEILTRSRVNNAYRDMALKYHPDKNRHLSEDELRKITEEFKLKKKSRDILLQYCVY